MKAGDIVRCERCWKQYNAKCYVKLVHSTTEGKIWYLKILKTFGGCPKARLCTLSFKKYFFEIELGELLRL